MPNDSSLTDKLKRVQEVRAPAIRWNSPDVTTYVGLDTQTIPSEYQWDGLKRGADPNHPFLVFQYTLSGWGFYAAHGAMHRMTPGKAFMAVIPSAHAYYLPPESSQWTFFYVLIRHPYIVSRIIETQKRAGAVMTLDANDMLLARAVKIFEGTMSGTFRDEWAMEQALFDFLVEYERFAQRLLYPDASRQTMLDDIRHYVLAQSGKRVEVDELAGRAGMSRSHFSHRFKAVTGLSPAQWVGQVCLDEATRRLCHSDAKLEVIARETGFANANHLCKVFRRNFHLSPGEFRRQMR